MSDYACNGVVQSSANKTATFRCDGDGKLVLLDVGGVVRRTWEVRRTVLP